MPTSDSSLLNNQEEVKRGRGPFWLCLDCLLFIPRSIFKCMAVYRKLTISILILTTIIFAALPILNAFAPGFIPSILASIMSNSLSNQKLGSMLGSADSGSHGNNSNRSQWGSGAGFSGNDTAKNNHLVSSHSEANSGNFTGSALGTSHNRKNESLAHNYENGHGNFTGSALGTSHNRKNESSFRNNENGHGNLARGPALELSNSKNESSLHYNENTYENLIGSPAERSHNGKNENSAHNNENMRYNSTTKYKTRDRESSGMNENGRRGRLGHSKNQGSHLSGSPKKHSRTQSNEKPFSVKESYKSSNHTKKTLHRVGPSPGPYDYAAHNITTHESPREGTVENPEDGSSGQPSLKSWKKTHGRGRSSPKNRQTMKPKSGSHHSDPHDITAPIRSNQRVQPTSADRDLVDDLMQAYFNPMSQKLIFDSIYRDLYQYNNQVEMQKAVRALQFPLIKKAIWDLLLKLAYDEYDQFESGNMQPS